MARKRYKPEEIVSLLRQAEVAPSAVRLLETLPRDEDNP